MYSLSILSVPPESLSASTASDLGLDSAQMLKYRKFLSNCFPVPNYHYQIYLSLQFKNSKSQSLNKIKLQH